MIHARASLPRLHVRRAFVVLWVGALATITGALLPAASDGIALADDGKPQDAGDEKATKAHAPAECVELATSWAQAIKDAKARSVPLVVHVHGFYCPPCWGLHKSLMSDPEYVTFAYEHTVEVLALDRLQEGVDKGEDRAATFDVKVGRKTVQHLVEFPGLTVEDVLALRRSKASTYNKSGGLPYTALVDPFTEDELKSWKGGGVTPAEVMEAVKEARTKLAKTSKGKPRAELRAVADLEATAAAKTKTREFAAVLDACAAADKKADKDGWPKHLRARVASAREASIAAATEALDAIEAAQAEDAVQAKKDLSTLLPRLRGTGLEDRAKTLLATL